MWKEELENGKVRYVERYTDPWTGKDKKVSKTFPKHTRQNEKAAYEILTAKISKLSQCRQVKNLQLHDAVKMYLEDMKKRVRESTYNSTCYNSKSLLLLPNIEIEKINPFYVTKYVQPLKDGNRMLWNTLCNWLKKSGLTTTDLPKAKRETRKKTIYDNDRLVDIDAFKKIKEQAQSYTLTQQSALLLFDFCLNSGLRHGEAAALTTDDIKDGFININKTWSDCTGKVGAPKTIQSNRKIELTPQLEDIIRKSKSLKIQMRFHGKTYKKNNLVFPTSRGIHLRLSTANTFLKKTLGENCSTHNARHTYATQLLESGIPVDTVARLLGHDGTASVQATYGHITKKIRQRDFDLVRNIKIG